MEKNKRHYVRNSVKENNTDSNVFYLYWKLVRLRNMLSSVTNDLTNRLNNCGWLFREGDTNHKYYIRYQRKEELVRLCSWVCNQINKHNMNDISSDIINYAVYIANEIYKEIKKSTDYYSARCEMYERMAKKYVDKLNARYAKTINIKAAVKYMNNQYNHKVLLNNNDNCIFTRIGEDIVEMNNDGKVVCQYNVDKFIQRYANYNFKKCIITDKN